MSKLSPVTISSNVTYAHVAQLKNNNYNTLAGAIQISGIFGGGLLALYLSLDGGLNKIPMKDELGISYNTNDIDLITYNIPVKTDNNYVGVDLYCSLTGATNPSIVITIVDNR